MSGVYLVFFEPSKLKSKDQNLFVSAATWSDPPFIHVDMAFHPSQVSDENARFDENRPKVQYITATTITRNSEGVNYGYRPFYRDGYCWMKVPCTKEQFNYMLTNAESIIEDGAPKTYFSYSSFLRCGLGCPSRRPDEGTRGWFCSQYLTTLLQSAGLIDGDINPSSVSATQLYRICIDIPGAVSCSSPIIGHGGDSGAVEAYNRGMGDYVMPIEEEMELIQEIKPCRRPYRRSGGMSMNSYGNMGSGSVLLAGNSQSVKIHIYKKPKTSADLSIISDAGFI